PVQYFIAPELATDREARGAREITLSYTFYPSVDAPAGPNA
ncbi:cytochrome C oxidase assembly protein, partial [Devosia limi DSM 17137]